MHKGQVEINVDEVADSIKSAGSFKRARAVIDGLLAKSGGAADIEYFHILCVIAAEVCPSFVDGVIKNKTCEYYFDLYDYISCKFADIAKYEVPTDSAEELEFVSNICRSVIMDTSHSMNVLMNGGKDELSVADEKKYRKRILNILTTLENAAVAVLKKYKNPNNEVAQSIMAWENDIADNDKNASNEDLQ